MSDIKLQGPDQSKFFEHTKMAEGIFVLKAL